MPYRGTSTIMLIISVGIIILKLLVSNTLVEGVLYKMPYRGTTMLIISVGIIILKLLTVCLISL